MDVIRLKGLSTRDPLPFSGKHSGETFRQYKKQSLKLLGHPKYWAGGELASTTFEALTPPTRTATSFLHDEANRTASALLREPFKNSTSYLCRALEDTEKFRSPLGDSATSKFLHDQTQASDMLRDMRSQYSVLGREAERFDVNRLVTPDISPMHDLAVKYRRIQAEERQKREEREDRHQAEIRELNERIIKAQEREWHETWWFKAILALGAAAIGSGVTILGG